MYSTFYLTQIQRYTFFTKDKIVSRNCFLIVFKLGSADFSNEINIQ